MILNVEVDLPHDFINQLMAENIVESSIDVSTKQIKVVLLKLLTTTTNTSTDLLPLLFYYY